MDPHSEPPFSAQDHLQDNKIHILLAASGSVATIKIPNIAEALGQYPNVSVRIIVTESAERFLAAQSAEQPLLDSLCSVPGVDGIYRDSDEWSQALGARAPILHIELRKWAHILLVAPLSANTMAKMTIGMADNLLLSVLRAWDTTGLVDLGFKARKPMVFLAPAMNTAMYVHPVTEKSLKILRDEWGKVTPILTVGLLFSRLLRSL
ncbi:Flavoprotein [Penicillium hetheringtonii]|uniref:Flavoprotein n=1 Tax=Penicillium hetheringtonii TaxID=911720 RepID=A0AAD6DFU5_9EURO|nr:Flavoprotein [Penicillium hetheringtonii]